MGWVLACLGLAGFVVGALALARGFNWKPASVLLLASWLAIFEGATLAGSTSSNNESSSTPSASAPASPPSDGLTVIAESATRPASIPELAVEGVVGETIDGATFTIAGADFPPPGQKVRLLGVAAAPAGDCYADEAKSFLDSQLAASSKVYLLAGDRETDPSGALLRFAWNAEGEFVNESLVESGFAKAAGTSSGDARMVDVLSAGAEAEAAGRGLWGVCNPVPAPSPSPGRASATPEPGTTTGGGRSCEPSLPDFCVPVAGRDLDCEDIGRTDFRVLSPDPHKLDGGIVPGVGCESGDVSLELRMEAEQREKEERRRQRDEDRESESGDLFPGGLLDLSDD